MTVCPPDFFDWHRELTSLQQPAAYRRWEPNLTGVEVPERLTGMRVTGDFFTVLGVAPVAGRVLMPEDERANARAVVIGHGLWRRHFGGDAAIVGRAFVLNGEAHTVVGIMPDSFQFPDRSIEIWGPLNLDRERADRAEHSLRVVARLRAGADIGGARAELATLMARQGPENEGDSADLVPLRDWYVGATSRKMLWGLLGAVALLLLTACANVANLALARGTGRAREMMIRTAIGATRRRLIAQLVVESVALSVVAGLVGLLFAMWTADVLVASLPQTSVYRMSPLTTDWRVLLFTFAVATVAGLLFGIAPALRYSRARFDVGQLSTRTPSGSLQRLLLVAQTALAVTLIAGAALLARSFVQLWTIQPGFSSENVMAARISLPTSLPESRQVEFFSDVVRRLEANPTIAAAGAVTFLPLSGEGSGGFITFEGREAMSAESGSRPGAARLIVTPGYFDALRITLKEGRFLKDDDATNGLPVVVVNEAMARRYWPGESPVGKRIKRGTPTAKFPWMTVVGVVGDVRQMNLIDPVGSTIYLPLTQFPSSAMSLTVRTTATNAGAIALIRAAVRETQRRSAHCLDPAARPARLRRARRPLAAAALDVGVRRAVARAGRRLASTASSATSSSSGGASSASAWRSAPRAPISCGW